MCLLPNYGLMENPHYLLSEYSNSPYTGSWRSPHSLYFSPTLLHSERFRYNIGQQQQCDSCID